jgi:uncharacterized protein
LHLPPLLEKLRQFLKHSHTREKILNNPMLKWMGPWIHAHHLWHWSKQSVALGMAVGVFIGILIPVAQIPVSAGVVVVARAHLPAAIAGTFVSNPFTTPAILYGAYQLGLMVTGERKAHPAEPPPLVPGVEPKDSKKFWSKAQNFGKPLLVGLTLMASTGGLVSYLAIIWLWNWREKKKRQRLTGSA